MTVGAFFKAGSLVPGSVLRMGLTNGGADAIAALRYGSTLWDGTEARLDLRTGPANSR